MDIEKLDSLIALHRVTLDVLAEQGLNTSQGYKYLFLCDNISLTEYMSYFNVRRATAYRKIGRFPSSPDKVFADENRYFEFLEWRRSDALLSVSVQDVAKMLHVSRRSIYYLIQAGKLINDGRGRILITSIRIYLLSQKHRIDVSIDNINKRIAQVNMIAGKV
jgi:predicted DNA-binding protein YlxM (UPF0122 family)